MRLTRTKMNNITLDNENKIDQYLEELGLTKCNPAKEPLTKDIVTELINAYDKGE